MIIETRGHAPGRCSNCRATRPVMRLALYHNEVVETAEATRRVAEELRFNMCAPCLERFADTARKWTDEQRGGAQ